MLQVTGVARVHATFQFIANALFTNYEIAAELTCYVLFWQTNKNVV